MWSIFRMLMEALELLFILFKIVYLLLNCVLFHKIESRIKFCSANNVSSLSLNWCHGPCRNSFSVENKRIFNKIIYSKVWKWSSILCPETFKYINRIVISVVSIALKLRQLLEKQCWISQGHLWRFLFFILLPLLLIYSFPESLQDKSDATVKYNLLI